MQRKNRGEIGGRSCSVMLTPCEPTAKVEVTGNRKSRFPTAVRIRRDRVRNDIRRLLAASRIGEAAAPPVVVLAFFGEVLVEAPAAGFDTTMKSEPERDGEKSSD